MEIELFVEHNSEYTSTGHTSITNVRGDYLFDTSLNLMPGVYQVREIQPDGYFNVGATVGLVGGVPTGSVDVNRPNVLTEIDISTGGFRATEYNFVEGRPASLSGHVYHDRNNDGLRDAHEEGIARAVLSLLDEAGSIVQSVETDGGGRYEFKGVRAGNYRIM